MNRNKVLLILLILVLLLVACGKKNTVNNNEDPNFTGVGSGDPISDADLLALDAQYWAENPSLREEFAGLLMESYVVENIHCDVSFNLLGASATGDGRILFSFETADGSPLEKGFYCGSLADGSISSKELDCQQLDGYPTRLYCYSPAVTEGLAVDIDLVGPMRMDD